MPPRKQDTFNLFHQNSMDGGAHATPDPTSHDGEGYAEFVKSRAVTDLLFLASIGNVARAKRIVSKNNLDLTDEETADYDKRTPLHLAAACGSFAMTTYLIEAGVPINATDRFGRTPLEDAVRGHRGDSYDIIKLLIDKGAKVRHKGDLVSLDDSPLDAKVPLGSSQEVDMWEINPVELTDIKTVGEGAFGTVKMSRWRGTMVAVKSLKAMSEDDKVAIGEFRTEIGIMKHMHHPHIVQFLGTCTVSQPYKLVTEYMEGGSLIDLLNKGAMTPQRAVMLLGDCARGMAYLHAFSTNTSVIHRDLKPGNLMLTKLGRLKVGDFGLSKTLSVRNLHDESTYTMTGETGSYRYMAPEVFRHETYNNSVDVYAFAMIAYQMFEYQVPFDGLGGVDAAVAATMHNRRPDFSNNTRADIQDLLKRCWSGDPKLRPSFTEIIDELDKIQSTLPPTTLKEIGIGGPHPLTADEGSGCCTVQ
mmetsp:Transcript_596/g.1914  ORF Transcript_596/g.1914 Transcript_596/m.1914 type:complete len:473 (-) Transcript_596:716-2134(-)